MTRQGITIRREETQRWLLTAFVLLLGSISSWLSALFRDDHRPVEAFVVAAICTAALALAVIAGDRFATISALSTTPLLIGLLTFLAARSNSDVYRVMDGAFMVAVGAFAGWTGYDRRRPLVLTAGFAAFQLAFVVVASASADDTFAVAWATATTAVMSIGAAFVIASLRRAREALSVTDPLTGVLNRRGFDLELQRLEGALLRDRARPYAVVSVDLDGLKELNDSRGHAAGDRAIVEVASRWRQAVRIGDVVARVGGDEFAVILPDCPLAYARVVVGRVRSLTETPFSCGITTVGPEESIGAALVRADTALYADKRDRRRPQVPQDAYPEGAA